MALTGRLFCLPHAFASADQDRARGLEDRIAAVVAPALAAMGYELVQVALLGRSRPTVQIMADRADGGLIGLADCEAISRSIGPLLDVDDPIPGAWTLEVSSAGIDRPLVRVRDWNRFAGHLARVEMQTEVEGRKRFSGTIVGADAAAARLATESGEVTLPLGQIRRAKLVLTDRLIAATAQTPPSSSV